MLFNGIDPRTIVPGIISVSSAVDDAMPPRKLNLVQLRRGAGFAGFELGPRNIAVSINIGARRKHKALEASRHLIGWATTKKPAPMVLNHEPDKFYNAICADCSPKTLRNTFIVLDFTFTAPDPRAFELEESRAVLNRPFEVPGTASTSPVITQTLAAQAQGLRYTLDGGQYVELVGTIPAGCTVEVDLGARTVRMNNLLRPDLLDFVNSRWFELAPGAHTIISSTAGDAAIRWHNAWL